MRWVVGETLMPSQKWIIKSRSSNITIKELTGRPGTKGDHYVEVLFHALVITRVVPCRAESFIDSVPVHAPHVGNSIFYLVFIGHFGQVCWGYEPEEHVVALQLEECYI